MTVHDSKAGGRVQFGALAVAPSLSKEEQAIEAMGQAVPTLEAALGFPLRVTAEVREDGLIWVEVILPDEHYSGRNGNRVSQGLREAARPFTQMVYIETDSDAPYAQ